MERDNFLFWEVSRVPGFAIRQLFPAHPTLPFSSWFFEIFPDFWSLNPCSISVFQEKPPFPVSDLQALDAILLWPRYLNLACCICGSAFSRLSSFCFVLCLSTLNFIATGLLSHTDIIRHEFSSFPRHKQN